MEKECDLEREDQRQVFEKELEKERIHDREQGGHRSIRSIDRPIDSIDSIDSIIFRSFETF